jgi:hypothetical protein
MRARTLLVLAAAACGSTSTYRTTRIAAPGHTELLVGTQASGAGFSGERGALPVPELAIAGRRAVTERIELQLNGTVLPIRQAWTGSAELAGKLRIGARGRWSLAVGAAAGYRLAESGGAYIEGVMVSAPVIAGIELGRHQLVVSVIGGTQRWWSSGARPVDVPFIGDSLGLLWRVGESWALLPEIGVAWTPARNFMTDDSRLFHAGIAVVVTR